MIIVRLLKARFSHERFFVLLVMPDKRGIASDVRNMSGALIHDAMHACLSDLVESGKVRQNFSDDEVEEFHIPVGQ